MVGRECEWENTTLFKNWSFWRRKSNNKEGLIVFTLCFFLLELKEICELTGIDQSVLERAFSFRTVEAKQEKVSTTLNVAQVKRGPDLEGKNNFKWQFYSV